jgi:hypothetical protein
LTGAPFDLFPHAVAESDHGAHARPRRFARAEAGKGQTPREREEDVLKRGRDELADEDWIDCRTCPACGRGRCFGDDLAESSAYLFRKGCSEREALVAAPSHVSAPRPRDTIPKHLHDALRPQRIDQELDQSLAVDEIAERPCEHEVDDQRDSALPQRTCLRPQGPEDARESRVHSLGHRYGTSAL